MIRSRLIAYGLLLALATGCGRPTETPADVVLEPRDEAVGKAKAVKRLNRIGAAIRSERPADSVLPYGIVGPDGRLGLSWRVALLPNLGEGELYKQFRLTEAWDSEHNKKLLDKMPEVYASAGKDAGPGRTFLRSFAGTGAFVPVPVVLPKGGKPVQPWGRLTPGMHASWIGTFFSDGTANTMMAAEAVEPVEWTRPDELPLVKEAPPPKLGGLFAGGFHAVMCDGRVHFFPDTLDESAVRALITKDGGERLTPTAHNIIWPNNPQKPPTVGRSLPDQGLQLRLDRYRRVYAAIRDYHAAVGHLPAGIATTSGPGLSWRVQILPFMGQEALYNEFKLDEAWDSDHNKQLIEKVPYYLMGYSGQRGGETDLRTTCGLGGIIPTTRNEREVKAGQPLPGRHLADISDGLANTILLFESSEPVVWTCPDECVVTFATAPTSGRPPLPPFCRKTNGIGFVAVMADGRTTHYRDYPPAELAKMLTPRGGETVDPLAAPEKIWYSDPLPASFRPKK